MPRDRTDLLMFALVVAVYAGVGAVGGLYWRIFWPGAGGELLTGTAVGAGLGLVLAVMLKTMRGVD